MSLSYACCKDLRARQLLPLLTFPLLATACTSAGTADNSRRPWLAVMHPFNLQAQQMIADDSGLALAVSLSYACGKGSRARQLLPLLAFSLLAPMSSHPM